MSIDERLDLERDDRRHESTQARLGGGRLKFTCCPECGSDFGMHGVCREALAESSSTAIERFAPWYRDSDNDLLLYYPCLMCNRGGEHIPDWLEWMTEQDVLAWLNADPMAPDTPRWPPSQRRRRRSKIATTAQDRRDEMDRDELLTMPEADAIAALADEANWPADVTGAVKAEWYKMTAEKRLGWLRNVEEIQRTMDADAFRQWQGRGPDRRRGSSIPAYYRGYWRANSRRLRR